MKVIIIFKEKGQSHIDSADSTFHEPNLYCIRATQSDGTKVVYKYALDIIRTIIEEYPVVIQEDKVIPFDKLTYEQKLKSRHAQEEALKKTKTMYDSDEESVAAFRRHLANTYGYNGTISQFEEYLRIIKILNDGRKEKRP